jgi:murein DD-endopeptidase MepM/ murein hydrolase activator NlpD
MNSLLENQQISKRRFYGSRASAGPSGVNPRRGTPRHASRNPSKPAFRPRGLASLFEGNSKLIENIRQNPVRVHRGEAAARKAKKKREPFFDFSFLSAGERRAPETERTENNAGGDISGGHRRREGYNLSFVFPAVPAAALLLLALGVFFINYGNGGLGDSLGDSLGWLRREVVTSDKDQGSRYSMARYAGVNPVENLAESPGERIPLDLTETFEWLIYKVKKGDSVSKIAAAYSVSMDAVIASNGITNARALREGEVLRIPNMDGIPYTVKSGDNLSGISKSMGVPLEAILDANDIQSDIINAGMTLFIPGARMQREELRMALGELFIYPLKGARLSSPFGWRDDPITGVRRHHAAIDLSAPLGTPVKAAMEGRVSVLGFNMTYGNFIILEHSGGFQSMYAHMNTFSVKKGDWVGQGIQIGTVGNTGYSTGPHLHFAVFKNNRAVNPLDFLNPRM